MTIDLAQDIWPDATPEQIAVLATALRRAFDRLASPSTNDPAPSSTNGRTSKQAGSSLSVAFKQHNDSVDHEKNLALPFKRSTMQSCSTSIFNNSEKGTTAVRHGRSGADTDCKPSLAAW